MSTTIVQEKRETTLPHDVAEAAGLQPGDQVDWTFEAGEIRGRKLPSSAGTEPLKLVDKAGYLMLEGKFDREDILASIRADREGKH